MNEQYATLAEAEARVAELKADGWIVRRDDRLGYWTCTRTPDSISPLYVWEPAAAPTTRRTETPVEALQRLAAKARAEGIELYRAHDDESLFVTSASTPGWLHRVDPTAPSCDCEGFRHWGRCKHLALALVELGRLELPKPATRPCSFCNGSGRWHDSDSWATGPCAYCGGSGRVPDARPTLAPVVPFPVRDDRPAA